MKTINANSTGNQFIQDINDNFAECISGGNGTVNVNVPLQGGKLMPMTGYVDGRWCAAGASGGVGTWTDDDFYKYLHTPCYLSLVGNKVKSVTTPVYSTLSIFCYDDDFALIGNAVAGVQDIPDTAVYVKMQLSSSSDYAQVKVLEMVLATSPKWVKNVASPMTPQWFNYDCRPPKLWDTEYTVPHAAPTGLSADADNTRYHDNAYVLLPPNYDPNGTPCKVVLWLAGDGQHRFINHDVFHDRNGGDSIYESNLKLFNACGYAVVQCGGYTSMWHGEEGATNASKWISRITPAYMASVRALYDHIMRNYNFEQSIYVGAKSAGGGILLDLATNRPFPVRAAAGINTIVSNFDMMRYSITNRQKSWQKMLGCANWDDFILTTDESGYYATVVNNAAGANADQLADATRLSNNKDIIRKYDPFGSISNIDWDDFVTECLKMTTPFNGGADYPTALTDIIFAATKVVTTPLKYWCATQDKNVPYTWHKIMVDWLTMNGGTSELRSYSGGDHNTFDNDTNTASYVTPYGGTITASIGFIEMVEWFKRW